MLIICLNRDESLLKPLERKGECRSEIFCASYSYGLLVRFEDMLDDGQTQSRTAYLP